jgi:hypothetical protein
MNLCLSLASQQYSNAKFEYINERAREKEKRRKVCNAISISHQLKLKKLFFGECAKREKERVAMKVNFLRTTCCE